MGEIPNPTYALVVKRTMAKPTFLNAFSWKCSFLVKHHSQCISNRNGPRIDLAKETKKVACLEPTLTCNTIQQNLTTGKAVATTVAESLATNPGSYIILPNNNSNAQHAL